MTEKQIRQLFEDNSKENILIFLLEKMKELKQDIQVVKSLQGTISQCIHDTERAKKIVNFIEKYLE